MMEVVQGVKGDLGVGPSCAALGLCRATYYRRLRPGKDLDKPRPRPARALSDWERREVLKYLHSERFVDKAPAEIQAILLDEGIYLCSLRTMYRILEGENEVRERRNQMRHPHYSKPELLATAPNQVWSWDITKLLGPAKWVYFYLYVILDIFSRYVVGWLLAHQESAGLAKRLIQETCEKQNISSGQLIIHSDRGAAMKAKTVAQKLADLGVIKSHSRPYVSDDNPFSESQFKTMKYRPEFPDRFGCFEDSLTFCRDFFAWYNTEHRHSGIAMLTPGMVHCGQGPKVLEARQAVLTHAYRRHPERFVQKAPSPPKLLEAVWINPPGRDQKIEGRKSGEIKTPDPTPDNLSISPDQNTFSPSPILGVKGVPEVFPNRRSLNYGPI